MSKILVGDFETTVYKGQKRTDVWAAAFVELGTEDVQLYGNIYDAWDYLVSLNQKLTVYFHNLKFDGAFLLSFFLKDKHFKQAYNILNEEQTDYEFLSNKEMPNNSVKYLISDLGQWYTITVKINNNIIEFRDSLKLLPFSVKEIGRSFKTKHQKLDMEYEGIRYPNCEITAEEQEYIKNDVLVVKEALEIMFAEGHDKLTIGACCLNEFKHSFDRFEYRRFFPDLSTLELTEHFKYPTADAYIRRAYKGGWCYVVKKKAHKTYYNGTTADVNSLYPSMMSSESGNIYPYGQPHFWSGNYIPKDALDGRHYYFIRIKTRFRIKPGYLPFIQIKNTFRYRGNECLESSSLTDAEGRETRFYTDADGITHDTSVELTLTMTDWKLMQEHYYLFDCEILDGCYFRATAGFFDDYMEKYKKQKQTSKGAKRQLAKLFLNNLYGKMATSTNSSFKVARVDENGVLKFLVVPRHDKHAGYIPIGAAITSYARNFTIRAAQANYHGIDKPGFIYADTDSIHCDLSPDEIQGIKVHPSDFCCWKLESEWDVAYFTRQKTYIEHVVKSDGEPCEPHYDVRCAGMSETCKELFLHAISDKAPETFPKYNELPEEQQQFLQNKLTLTDFDIGLKIPGKLTPRQIPGGVLLTETTYEMR